MDSEASHTAMPVLEKMEVKIEEQVKVESERPPQPRANLQSRLQSNKHDQAFLCVVCTDRASGYHYGVPACEGCKAFFKRSLQSKDLNYKCPASSNCTIDRMSRKCCQACRLKKCHDVGMSKEFLGNKIKRPKQEKQQKPRRKSDKSSPEGFVESSTNAQEIEIENAIQSLTSLHAELYLKPEDCTIETRTLTQKFSWTVDQQLVHIIDWAKQLPGYCNLVISDQAILLQAAWVDLLALNWVYHSLYVEEAIKFSKFFSITYNEARELGCENIYCQIFSLANRAKKYNMDEEEIACLKAISLTNAESSSLAGPEKVNDLITTFSSTLQYYTNSRHRENPQKFAKLVLILPQLKYMVNQVIEYLYTMKMNNSSESNLSDLVIEMLEAKQRL
ncbi:steroid hormone receptor ERR2-like [Hydractinia symbiolongicarpus]|uniref:steroid hormone receptor ERR2-like n=1 Tax=Hydractinia symbiolongicarpus TaxID=13093 RepID=UPI00254E767D|nr:steroid hormone receptor ERR2-like [Hydractinia symbiolongicarpus]XP_057303380.1 steroid hormone receptor ERR2-like [Hydractinia symbiolongicarpus]XP_057303381.1 steroid hormone receptor ERR2-like [Hydractinia symbiolongicarpus]XP_057303382.1 steroid hormone receptor ERR2-like [Hydractinia symbiolongicarpus]XP_057303383.1 steroid hormone receptor ERR2-like [Hydractinia symbiolongicarpus]